MAKNDDEEDSPPSNSSVRQPDTENRDQSRQGESSPVAIGDGTRTQASTFPELATTAREEPSTEPPSNEESAVPRPASQESPLTQEDAGQASTPDFQSAPDSAAVEEVKPSAVDSSGSALSCDYRSEAVAEKRPMIASMEQTETDAAQAETNFQSPDVQKYGGTRDTLVATQNPDLLSGQPKASAASGRSDTVVEDRELRNLLSPDDAKEEAQENPQHLEPSSEAGDTELGNAVLPSKRATPLLAESDCRRPERNELGLDNISSHRPKYLEPTASPVNNDSAIAFGTDDTTGKGVHVAAAVGSEQKESKRSRVTIRDIVSGQQQQRAQSLTKAPSWLDVDESAKRPSEITNPDNTIDEEDLDFNSEGDADYGYGNVEEEMPKKGCWKRWMKKSGRCWKRFVLTWPHTYELIFKVLVPMFILILVSFFFGYGLSLLESPAEFEHNDAILREKIKLEMVVRVNTNLTSLLPEVCLQAYTGQLSLDSFLANMTRTADNMIEQQAKHHGAVIGEMLDMYFLLRLVQKVRYEETEAVLDAYVSTDGLPRYINECSETIFPVVTRLFALATASAVSTGDDVTLSWSRCNSKDPTHSEASEFWHSTHYDSHFLGGISPDKQNHQYQNTFRRHLLSSFYYRRNLYMIEKGLNDTSQMFDHPHFEALKRAFMDASEQATGRTGCYANIPASVWFWFCIMTTVGYGNSTTRSVGGRAMVYTLGFLCILLFAGITARAGNVISNMFDHGIHRFHLTLLQKPTVALFVRASCYTLWILVIAKHYQVWQKARLDNTIGLDDGYWFGYISTTTVGLGDYYLEPEVITYGDLITYPILFLFGFVLLASFLDKLAELLIEWSKKTKKAAKRLTVAGVVQMRRMTASVVSNSASGSERGSAPSVPATVGGGEGGGGIGAAAAAARAAAIHGGDSMASVRAFMMPSKSTLPSSSGHIDPSTSQAVPTISEEDGDRSPP